MVTRQDLGNILTAAGKSPQTAADLTDLHISSKVIRCDRYDVGPAVFVANEKKEDDIRNAVVDGVHWVIHKHPQERRLAVYVPSDIPEKVAHALATLAASCCCVEVEIVRYDIVGGQVVRSAQRCSGPTFAPLQRAHDWAQALASRPTSLPSPAAELQALLQTSVPAFRWYRNVTSGFWSGRVGGWQVCTQKDHAATIRYGETDVDRRKHTPVNLATLSQAAGWVESFARKRAKLDTREGRHKKEHLLESAVWRGSTVVPVQPQGLPNPLEPIVPLDEPPLQVPALYSSERNAPARFIDAVMKDGTTPWVVELKVDTGGQGQYYRHAITQAVLYREFLLQATDMQGWFRSLEVDPNEFRAAVVFPKLKGSDAHRGRLFGQLRETAACFGVDVAELLEDWPNLHAASMGASGKGTGSHRRQ